MFTAHVHYNIATAWHVAIVYSNFNNKQLILELMTIHECTCSIMIIVVTIN